MSFVDTIGKFHIGLDGVGLLLQGAPGAPAYRVTNAPVYGTRFASGDRSYNDLSQWWYLIQTDWSGGVKELVSFEDDAQFYYSSNIDARTRVGKLRLDHALATVQDFAANNEEVRDVRNYIWGNGHDETLVLADGIYTTGGTLRSDASLGNVKFVIPFKKSLFAVGDGGVDYTTETTTPPYTFTSVDAAVNLVIDGSVDSAQAAVNVGEATLYVFGISTTGNLFVVTTTSATGATFTLIAEFSTESLGESVAGAVQYGSEIVFVTEGTGYWKLFSLDIATGVVSTLAKFDSGDQFGIYGTGARYLQLFKGKVLVTFLTNDSLGEGAIYTYDGSTIEKIFQTDRTKAAFSTPEAKAYLRGGAVIYDDCAFWGNLVYDGTSFFNFIKTTDDDVVQSLLPVGTDGDKLYLVDNEEIGGEQQSILYSYDKFGTTYKTGASNSAFLVFSQHDKLQSIDKLLHSITLGFSQFASGQAIAVYYSTNAIPDPNITTGGWTLLGTASYALDGATPTSKTMLFPVGTTARKVWIRVELVGGGSDTPEVNDLTLEYLPLPDYKMQWTLNINCADEVKRLDGRLVETTARELKARLMKAWMTKSALDYQDLDYASTLVNDATFDATETTVTVDSTAFFPEQGRIKVDDEEIFYTGKTPTTFTGCARGARGTRASTHADNAVVHNGYSVLVVDMDVRAPIILEDKNAEYVVGLTLREV